MFEKVFDVKVYRKGKSHMCASKKYAHVGMSNKIKVPAKFCKEIG